MTTNSILVVEDEEKILRLLEIELEYEGYEVGKAMDGIQALERYRSPREPDRRNHRGLVLRAHQRLRKRPRLRERRVLG